MSFLLHPVKKTQALKPDAGFTPPPLDGSLTIPEMFDWNYENNQDHPVFVHSDGAGGLRHLTFSEVVPAAHRAGRYIAQAAGIDLDANPSTYPVVAIFAASDSITYFTTLVGALRARIPVLPISPRFSANVIAHLLAETGAEHILVGVEPYMREQATAAVKEVITSYGKTIEPSVSLMPIFEDLYLKDIPFEALPPREWDYSATTLIVHSSGSTSFPKPIRWNARYQLQATMTPWLGAHDFCGQVFGCHAIELFHGLGLLVLHWLASTGLTLGTFAPTSPAATPTVEAVFQGFVDTKASYIFSPPALFAKFSEDPKKVQFLARAKGLMYGGKYLSRSVGNRLAEAGAKIFGIYGMTEAGQVSLVLPENLGMDWEYIALNPHTNTKFIINDDGTYDLLIVAKATQELAVKNAKYQGQDAWRTGDVMVPHPQRPELWKVLGRVDDQIMLTSGDTVNPCGLEDFLTQHPKIKSVLMFGRARPRTGIIVEPPEEELFDPLDMKKLAEFRDEIWPKVEEMNALAPKHGRVIKEMITVTSPAKPFTYSGKGAPIRALIFQEYQAELDAMYAVAKSLTNAKAPVAAIVSL